MFDPITIGAALTTANSICRSKESISSSRDIDMTGDLSRWMSAK